MRSAVFWGIIQCMVVLPYQNFGQPIGPIFGKSQEIQEDLLTLEDGTGRLSRNMSKELAPYAA